MLKRLGTVLPALAVCLATGVEVASAQRAGDLRLYKTAYYDLRADVAPERALEAWVRMDRAHEEYTLRTAGFAGPMRERYLFQLFTQEKDYLAAGGLPNSAGIFSYRGNAAGLEALDDNGEYLWHVIQHEGFHHFAWAQIQRQLPPWINEGLAEYFGEGEFTGDSYVFGFVYPGRLARIQEALRRGALKPFLAFQRTSQGEWNQEMSHLNYDQAWAMVQFLAQGDGKKYQGAFEQYMKYLSQSVDGDTAFKKTFGSNTMEFQNAWLKYWEHADTKGNEPLEREADVKTVVSFAARANAAGIKFKTVTELLALARAKKVALPLDPVRWLPASLLESVALKPVQPKWEMKLEEGKPVVTATYEDGVKVVGRFVVQAGFLRTEAVESGGKK
jgi:hypothetical protein